MFFDKFLKSNKKEVSIITEEMQKAAILRFCQTRNGKKFDVNNNFPKYLQYDFEITNPYELEKKLLSEGLLKLEDGLLYLTETGYTFCDQFKWLFEIENYHVGIKEYLDAADGRPFNDVIWGILNQRQLEAMKAGQLGLVRNSYFEMAVLADKEGKLNTALKLYITVLWHDLNSNGPAPAIVKYIAANKALYEDAMIKGLDYPQPKITLDTFKQVLERIFSSQDFNDLLCK